jgi:hypothetical protein
MYNKLYIMVGSNKFCIFRLNIILKINNKYLWDPIACQKKGGYLKAKISKSNPLRTHTKGLPKDNKR